jgi:hypothetical protein
MKKFADTFSDIRRTPKLYCSRYCNWRAYLALKPIQLIACLLCATVFFLSPSIAWTLVVGDRVQANGNVNVRSTPAGTVVGIQSNGALGTIVGGPQTATLNGTSFVWWQVNWDPNPDG